MLFTNKEFLDNFPGAAFQTFPDSIKSKNAFPTKGSLNDATDEQLQSLNRLGHGIFFSPNAMERGTRSIATCTNINSFFVDLDEGTKEEQWSRITHAPIHPSFIVESKNGYHIYFLATDATKDNFTIIQTTLIDYYKGDIQCKDISRVLRIPGFYHLKDTKSPFRIKIVDANPDLRYEESELIELFNINTSPTTSDTPYQSNHTAPRTLWECAANIDAKEALTRLSGTQYVNGEVYTFPPRSQGGYYIEVNGKIANAWVDVNGLIGSGCKGGPTILQWLKYYKYDYSRIASIIRAVFPDLIPQEILTGEVVTPDSPTSTPPREFEVLPTEDIKTVQALADTFVAHHIDRLFFCQEDQMVYIYDKVKHYHVALTFSDADEYINNFLIDIMRWNKNVSESLCGEIHRQIRHRAPRIELSEHPCISLKDGLFNMDTLQLQPHDQSIFCTIYLDVTSEELKDFQTPRWDSFVNEIMVHEDDVYKTDNDLKELYLQTLGYFLSPIKKPHAFVFYIGTEGRNGKGVTASVLKNIIGLKFISSLTLEQMSTQSHSTYALVGKRLNIAGEDESQFISNEILKKLASDDSITVNPKFRDQFDYIPQAKFLLLSNEAPRFSQIDNALKRRMVFVMFNREFLEHEVDWDLSATLRKELPGIVWQLINAYKRLRDNNYIFHKSTQSNAVVEQLEQEISATLNWFRTTFTIITKESDCVPSNFIFVDDLYSVFKLWCESSGRKIVSKIRWSREINKEFSLVSHRKYVGKIQQRGYYLHNKEQV